MPRCSLHHHRHHHHKVPPRVLSATTTSTSTLSHPPPPPPAHSPCGRTPRALNAWPGSTTPFFTALLAWAMQGARESHWTYLSLAPIALGVVIASGGEPMFNIVGFSCCLGATALRALKSVVQSILMTDPADKMDPMSLLLYMSAASVAFLVPAALLLEPAAYGQAVRLCSADTGFLWWLVGNSCLAYLVNLTNFLVTKYTSALTLQVGGCVRVCVCGRGGGTGQAGRQASGVEGFERGGRSGGCRVLGLSGSKAGRRGGCVGPPSVPRRRGGGRAVEGAGGCEAEGSSPIVHSRHCCCCCSRQVLGNAKGVVATFVSVMVFRNPVTWQGCAGYGVTVAGG